MNATKQLHRARSPRVENGQLTEEWFVSVDGKLWLGCSCAPSAEHYDEIASWFEVETTINADGSTSHFRRMVFARRYIVAQWGAAATILEPIDIA